jgi:hypothetical protein
VAFVEAPEVRRISAVKQCCVFGIRHPHILIYEQGTSP